MEATRTEVKAADGRRLAVFLSGPEDGRPLITHNGTPETGPMYGPQVEAGAERGLRHISYSRPGYGDSDRQPGRSVADCAADVAAVADALGIERFFTVGWSGGGPHTLATAALLGDRVLAAANIAGVAPWDAEGLDFLAGMGKENIEEFSAVEAGDEELRAFLEPEAEGLREVTAEEVIDSFGDLVSEVDKKAMTGDFGEFIAAHCRLAMSSGIWGWFDDDKAFLADWGFDLGRIDVPVAIWQGGQDRFVPAAHGEWLAENVSGATAHLRPEEGHLSLQILAYGEILDGLLTAVSG
jgi:pimeloyl-ACP methyl ester carboxylesterase